MSFFDLIGYAAGMLTTLSCLPQLRQSWRTRSVHDLSQAMLVIMLAGLALWVIYGIHERNWPIVVANILNFSLWSSLLWLKIAGERRPRT